MTFVGRIAQQQEDAEDVVQNAFVAAYKHLMDFDPQQALLSPCLPPRPPKPE
jgi:DNA-directed RNA polymerase specialized sigma24 family protein